MEKHYGGDSALNMQEIMKITSTPAGQQLIAALQRQGGSNLQAALQKASTGDYSDARNALGALMDNPEIKALMQQLGR